MKRLLNISYILATMLIVVGALLIFQNSHYGITILVAGLVLNIIYRLFKLPWKKLLKIKPLAVIKFLSVVILMFACVYMYSNSVNKFNVLIIAIIFDVIIHLKEDSRK